MIKRREYKNGYIELHKTHEYAYNYDTREGMIFVGHSIKEIKAKLKIK